MGIATTTSQYLNSARRIAQLVDIVWMICLVDKLSYNARLD